MKLDNKTYSDLLKNEPLIIYKGDEDVSYVKSGERIFKEISELKNKIKTHEKSLDRLQSFSGDDDEFNESIRLLKAERETVISELNILMCMNYRVDN